MSVEKPKRDESLKTTLLRWGFNFFPAYFSTGARVTFLSEDFREIHVELPYGWRTRDHHGQLFKGSQYGAVDPLYPMMLTKNLGDDYVVTEEEATVHFLEPCRRTVHAEIEVTEEDIKRIKDELNHHESVIRVYKIELIGEEGTVYTEVDKTLAISEAN